MMSILVCSECGSVGVATSRSVVLPFVCSGCLSKKSPDSGGPFRSASVPAVFAAPYGSGQTEGETHQVVDDLNDATATTEATVALIGDLESQLSLSKEVTAGQTVLIAALEAQVAELKAQKDADDEYIAALNRAGIEVTGELAEAVKSRETLGACVDDLVALSQGLVDRLGSETVAVARLEKENAILNEGISALERATGATLVISEI